MQCQCALLAGSIGTRTISSWRAAPRTSAPGASRLVWGPLFTPRSPHSSIARSTGTCTSSVTRRVYNAYMKEVDGKATAEHTWGTGADLRPAADDEDAKDGKPGKPAKAGFGTLVAEFTTSYGARAHRLLYCNLLLSCASLL